MALNSRDEAPNRGSKATTTINQNAVPQPNSSDNTSRDSFLRGSGLSGEEFDRRLRIKSIDFVAKEALHFEFNLKATTTTTSSSSSSSLNKVEDDQPQLPTDPPPSEKYFVLVQLLTAQYKRAVQHLKERARRDEEEAEEQGTWPTNWSAVAVPCRVLKAHLPEELAPRAVLQRFLLCTDVGDLLVLNMPELVERLENGNGNGSNNKRSNVDMLSSKIATTSISPTTDSNNNDICGGGIITRAKAKALEFNRSSTGSMGSKKSGVEEEQPFPPKPIQFSYFTLKLLDVYFTGPYRTNIYLEDQETQLEWRRLERLSSRRATPEQIRRRMPPRLMDKVVIDYPPPPEEEDDPDGSEIEASSKSFRLPPPPPPSPPPPPLKPSDPLNSPTNTASQQPNSEATRWKLELFFRHHQYDPATGASRLQPPPYPLEELNPRRVALVAPPIFPLSTTSSWGVFHQCQPSPAALELEYRLVMGALQRRKVELGEARAFTAARPLLQTLLHYRLGAPWEEVFERAARERSSGNLGGGPGPPVIPCQWLTDEHLPVAELPRTREAVQAAMTAATNYLFVVGSGYSCFNNNVGGPLWAVAPSFGGRGKRRRGAPRVPLRAGHPP
ncbi:hypothetical protein TYRP_020322 [Tyrophagus putrescentiae]|nr:hypothetical protein TYRP_020322 [Tyrophagus putrescentiae]